jgi:ferrochelatase
MNIRLFLGEAMGRPDRGLLLVNVGSPDSPAPREVRRYLREFLSDPAVMDIAAPLRWLILHLIILPFRPARSAKAYRRIWTGEGSPLLVHGRALVRKVRRLLGDGWVVELGMRYGNPSIRSALERLSERGIERLVVLPMYPQYSAAVTGSTRRKVLEQAGELDVRMAPSFYDHPMFIEALASLAQPRIEQTAPEKIFFSFHGLPLRQAKLTDDSGMPYREQCFATARLLAERLKLADDAWTVCFQSRLGRSDWIQPYTNEVLEEEARRGIRRAVVMSPSFVADCLETLHELGIEAVEHWKRHGGEILEVIPALNDTDGWADAVAAMARERG